MESGYAHSAFLASVLRAVREACVQNTEFKNRVFATGFLCIDVDGNHQNHYVINEEVVRNTERDEEEGSHSFCLKRIGFTQTIPQCTEKKNITQNMTVSSQKKYPSSPKRNFPRRSGTWSKYPAPSNGQKPRVEEKQTSVGTKPVMLAKSRQLKLNQTFTIEDDDEEALQGKLAQLKQGCPSSGTSPKRTWINQRAEDLRVRASSSQGTYSCASGFSNVSTKSRTSTQNAHKNAFLEDRNRSSMKRTKSYHNSLLRSKRNHQNITQNGPSSEIDFPHEAELIKLEEQLKLLDKQEFFDSEIAIASTKPPQGFVQRNLLPFQQPPCKHKSETYTPGKKILETFSTPNCLENDSNNVASPEEISALLNNVIEVLSHSKQSNFSGEQHAAEQQSISPQNSIISLTEYPQSSPRTVDSMHKAIAGLRYNSQAMRGHEFDTMSLAYMEHSCDKHRDFGLIDRSVNRSPDEAIRGCAEVTESPSVIKKKAKLFRWMKFFNKRDSGPYRLRDQQQVRGIPITESHTSVNSLLSTRSKNTKSPAFKKRRLGQTR